MATNKKNASKSSCTYSIQSVLHTFLLYMMKAALSNVHLRRSELWLIFIAGAVFKSFSSLCRNDLRCLMELTVSQVVNGVLLTRASLVMRSCSMMESLLHLWLLCIPCLVSLNAGVECWAKNKVRWSKSESFVAFALQLGLSLDSLLTDGKAISKESVHTRPFYLSCHRFR